MKTVFILGAGFSRYAGLPLVNDFYFASKDIYPFLDEVSKKSFDIIYDFWNKYSSKRGYLNCDLFNIEELLSIIEMHGYLELKDIDLKNQLISFITKVIETKTPEILDEPDRYSPYSKFVKKTFGIKSDKGYFFNSSSDETSNNSIISLNYDLIIENILEDLNRNNGSFGSFYHKRSNFIPHYGKINCDFEHNGKLPLRINYAKLHGSLNFTGTKVVPPTWNKTSNADLLEAWKLAHNLLQEGNQIIFIGYSLPSTDSYFKYLLINSISDKLKSIKVICLDNSGSIEKRYEDFIDLNFRNKGAEFYEFINQKFEDWIETKTSIEDWQPRTLPSI